MIVPVMAISNLVLTQQIYSQETNGAHAHYREPVPLMSSSQSEERTVFLTREKIDTSNQNPNDIFSRVRKMVPPIKSHRYVWVSPQSFRFL